MATTMMAGWCTVTLVATITGKDAFFGTVAATGDDALVSVADDVIIPRRATVLAEGRGIAAGVVSIKIEDVIAKVT